jgi:hypothetical protein
MPTTTYILPSGSQILQGHGPSTTTRKSITTTPRVERDHSKVCTTGYCRPVARLTTRNKGRVPALDATTGPVSSHTVVCNTRFDYSWEYRPGRINAADPLSRVSHAVKGGFQHYWIDATTGPVSSRIYSSMQHSPPTNKCEASSRATSHRSTVRACGITQHAVRDPIHASTLFEHVLLPGLDPDTSGPTYTRAR